MCLPKGQSSVSEENVNIHIVTRNPTFLFVCFVNAVRIADYNWTFLFCGWARDDGTPTDAVCVVFAEGVWKAKEGEKRPRVTVHFLAIWATEA